MSNPLKISIPVAEVFEPLLEPARYKGAYGGRGSGKSQFFAGLIVDDSLAIRGLNTVCIREVQKTLKQSAKKLIENKLAELRLGERHGFKVFNEVIKTPGDGVIIFQGMQDHTAESIKSLEGFNRAWIEEAQTLSTFSLSLLRPTIRAPGSEIWASWNPRRKQDPIDRLFRGEEKPTDAACVRANYSDNPWFPAELEQERLDCLRIDPDQYGHIWEGDYVTVSQGAYYAKQLAEARVQGRICRIGVDPLMALWAFWDIGGAGAKADATAIWIVQFVGKEVRFIDYYEAQGQTLGTHAQWLRDNGYGRAEMILPHDGRQTDKMFDVSYESELRKAGFSVPYPMDNAGTGAAFKRVEASRRLFPQMWFDAEKCAAGLDAIGWYHEKIDEARGVGIGPEHDWSSHGADAFGAVSVAYEILSAPKAKPKEINRPLFGGAQGWMG